MSQPTSPQTNPPTTQPPRRRPLTEAFDQEWTRLAAATSTRQSLARWGQSEPLLAPYDDLDGLLAATGHGASRARGRPCARGRRPPGRRGRARGEGGAPQTPSGAPASALRRGATGRWQVAPLFDELTAAGWIVVRTYPIERRPAKIAVNLLRDAEYEVCVRPFRLKGGRRDAIGDVPRRRARRCARHRCDGTARPRRVAPVRRARARARPRPRRGSALRRPRPPP